MTAASPLPLLQINTEITERKQAEEMRGKARSS